MVAGYAATAIICWTGLIGYMEEVGQIERLEQAFVANVFVARVRKLLRLARLSGRVQGPCLVDVQLIAAAAQAGSFSDQSLGIVADNDGSSSNSGSFGLHEMFCDAV